MNRSRLESLLNQQTGFVPPNPYDTAWVALVPDKHNPAQPAWPQALQYLRDTQLADGGWGDEHVYHAHGRTICTLAALWALLAWDCDEDMARIEAGIQALHEYAACMALEPYETIGFEMLLPRLVAEVKKFDLDLPLAAWARFEALTAQKMALIGRLQPNYDSPRSWWFSMEMLSEEQLGEIDDRILNVYGSVATSPAATAAYLRAKRLKGEDSRLATAYIAQVLHVSRAGVGFCYPLEQFEMVWTLDILRRAGVDPASPHLTPFIHKLAKSWQSSPQGMSWSQTFPIADGDITAVSYTILSWAGMQPNDGPFRRFWGADYYLNYPDELVSSISANIHALASLRYQPDNPQHLHMAERITSWLREQMARKGQFHDKWHFSPIYATSRAIAVLADWDNEMARQCLDFLLVQQNRNGGWGSVGAVNLEETSYATLGLMVAHRKGLLPDKGPLKMADAFLKKHIGCRPVEPFWIGKTLYQPVGVAHAYVYGAYVALQQLDVDYKRPSFWPKLSISQLRQSWSSS
ncbi:MAG: hypothetical protein H6658_08905 [Ardenticatenaceae bacterium]|nr:hypothetical protein [Ardenticatenaceae bacterium]